MNFLGMGPGELMVIMVLALIVFGPQKLPEIGRNVGKAIGEFRRATSSITEEINRELSLETPPPAREKKSELPAPKEPAGEVAPVAAEPQKGPLVLEINPAARAASAAPASNGADESALSEEVVVESPSAYQLSEETAEAGTPAEPTAQTDTPVELAAEASAAAAEPIAEASTPVEASEPGAPTEEAVAVAPEKPAPRRTTRRKTVAAETPVETPQE